MSESDLLVHAQRRIGSVLCGKYRLDSVLGVGGMAVVFAATHRNQKRVAIKMLHPELSIHEELRTRFLREGYAANTVDHPGAVAVLDDDTAEDGVAFLVMERLEGDEVDSLWERRGRRLDGEVVLAMTSQLLDVLAAAHARSIIHRDIKPSNLYVSRDGTLKVLDFGIARVRDAASAGSSSTSTGMMLGTPAYMAPEQALGKSKEIDATTDLWSVGATMFALLSGHFVHEGESATQLVVMSATTPARSLASVAPDVDPRVVALVDRALAFERAGRWPSALLMRDAVRATYVAMFGQRLDKEPLVRLVGGDEIGTGPTMHAMSAVPSAPPPALAPQVFTKAGRTLDEPTPAPVPRTREMASRPTRPGEPPPPVGPGPTRPLGAVPYGAPAGYAPGGLVLQGAPRQPASAATTALSSERDVPRPPGRNRWIVPAAILGTALGVGGGLFYGLSTRGASSSAAGAGLVESTPPPPTSAAAAAPQPPPVPATPPVPPPLTSSVPQTVTQPPAPRTPAPPPPAVVVPPVPASPRVAAPPTPSPPRAPSAGKPNCNPPYTVDEIGHHHMKPECE
jgi:serine/threonine-protein kinase